MRKICILLLTLTFTMNAGSCNKYSIHNQAIMNAEKNLPMETETTNDDKTKRINLQTVSFSPPEGFEDKSNHSSFVKYNKNGSEIERAYASHFNTEKRNLEFYRAAFYEKFEREKEKTKEFGQMVPATNPSMEVFLDKKVLIKGKYPALLIGKSTSVNQANGNRETGYERDAYIFDTQSTAFALAYNTADNSSETQKRFERMIESLELNTPSFAGDAPTSDGYVRRYSGNATVEVPVDLIPDRKFVYEKYRDEKDVDREKKVLRLTLLEPDDQEKLSEMKDADSIDKQHVGSIKNEMQKAVKTRHYTGELGEFTKVNYEGFKTSEYSMARKWTRLEAKDKTVIILQGTAPVGREKELGIELEKWMQTFISASERSN